MARKFARSSESEPPRRVRLVVNEPSRDPSCWNFGIFTVLSFPRRDAGIPVCASNSDSDVLVVRSADQRMRNNASDPLNRTRAVLLSHTVPTRPEWHRSNRILQIRSA